MDTHRQAGGLDPRVEARMFITLGRAVAELIFSQNPRSTVMYVPFVWIMWGTTGGTSKAIIRSPRAFSLIRRSQL